MFNSNTCTIYKILNTQMEILLKSIFLSVPQAPGPSSRGHLCHQKVDYQTSALYLAFPSHLLFIVGVIPYQFIAWYHTLFCMSCVTSIVQMNNFFFKQLLVIKVLGFLVTCCHRQCGNEYLCIRVLEYLLQCVLEYIRKNE